MKRMILFIAIFLFILTTIISLVWQTPARVVQDAINQVNKGDLQHVQLRQADSEKIKSFFAFAEEKHLTKPMVQVTEVADLPEQTQVIATFQVIAYGKDNRIEQVHDGILLFTLEKSSVFQWKITSVDIQKPLGE